MSQSRHQLQPLAIIKIVAPLTYLAMSGYLAMAETQPEISKNELQVPGQPQDVQWQIKVEQFLEEAQLAHGQQDYARALNAAEKAYALLEFVQSEELGQRISKAWQFYNQEFHAHKGNEESTKKLPTSADKQNKFSDIGYEKQTPLQTEIKEHKANVGIAAQRIQNTLKTRTTLRQWRLEHSFDSFKEITNEKEFEYEEFFNKKTQYTYRRYGSTNPYFPGNLFYQAQSREAFTAPKGKLLIDADVSSASASESRTNGALTSLVDLDFRKLSMGFHYGLTSQFDVGINFGYANVDGKLSMIDTRASKQYIANQQSSWAFDDTDLEFTYAPISDWAKALLSIMAPLNSYAYDSKQTISFAVKLPTGDKGQYLSSGSMDYAFSMRSSHSLGSTPLFLDSGLHLTVPGEIDSSVFNDSISEAPFLTIDYTLGRTILPNTLGYASVAYNTRQTDSMKSSSGSFEPFDIYANDGLNFKLGARYYRVSGSNMFLPSATIFMRDADRFGFQLATDFKF